MLKGIRHITTDVALERGCVRSTSRSSTGSLGVNDLIQRYIVVERAAAGLSGTAALRTATANDTRF